MRCFEQVDVKPLHVTTCIAWSRNDREQAAAFKANFSTLIHKRPDQETGRFVLAALDIAPEAHDRVLRGEPVRDEEIWRQASGRSYSIDSLLLLPDAASLALWNSFPAHLWNLRESSNAGPIRALLARHDVRAMPGFIAYARAYPFDGLQLAKDVRSAALVPIALHALRNHDTAKQVAIEWVATHARATAIVALPLAFGPPHDHRDDARFGVHWMARNGFESVAREVAATYGARMSAALPTLLEDDFLESR